MSSGERKRIRPNLGRAIPVGGCVLGVVGSPVPVPTRRAGVTKPCLRRTGLNTGPQRDGPVAVGTWSSDGFSQVARAPWNPVRIRADRCISLNIPV